jgi:hypothetical protein
LHKATFKYWFQEGLQISRHIFPLLSISPCYFGSFEAEADIDIVWLELIVEVNN